MMERFLNKGIQKLFRKQTEKIKSGQNPAQDATGSLETVVFSTSPTSSKNNGLYWQGYPIGSEDDFDGLGGA